MTQNNPMFKAENIQKMMNSLAITGTKNTKNNFKAGNGKISEIEQIAYDILIPLEYFYNYAIGMKEIRIAYPEKRFTHNYKPDFVNLKKKIAIEIDGSNHGGKHKSIDNKEEFREEIKKICMEN